MNKYDNYISEILSKTDFLLGKELNERVKEQFSALKGHERKIVQRAVDSGIIRSSVPVTFGNGQYAYFHSSKFLDKEMILKITKQNRPGLYRIIKTMDYNRGIISEYEIKKLSAAPIESGKSKSDSVEKLVEELRELKLGQEVISKKGVRYIVRPKLVNDCDRQMEEQEQRMSIDTIFIPDILKSLKGYNIIDNSRILYRNKLNPEAGISHNNFVWDCIAYTKTTGINEGKSSEANSYEKQTLVVLDVVVSRPYRDEDLQGFFARIQSTFNSVKTGKRKILPIIVYSDTESKILVNRIHKLGILTFDLGSIYGSKIFHIIRDLFAIKQKELTDASQVQPLIESTLSTIKLAGQEDNLRSLKGDLFESLMQPVLRLIYPDANIEHGRKLKEKKDGKEEGYEYDFIVTSSRLREIIVIELKGYSSSKYISLGDQDTKNTIRWFFNRTFPFAARKLNVAEQNFKVTGCYITTSKFHPEGITALEKLSVGKLKPSEIEISYDGEKLLQLLDRLKLQKSKDIILKYYIQEEDTQEQIDDEPEFAPSVTFDPTKELGFPFEQKKSIDNDIPF